MQKKISLAILVLFTLSFFAVSCSTANNALPTSSSPVTPESITIGIISPREALELMYGKDKTFSSNNETVMLTTKDGLTYSAKINTLVCYWELGLEKCVVITDYNYGSCHICSAYIDGAVFHRVGTGWKLHTFNSEIRILGSFGAVGKGELIRISNERYAVLLKSGYGNQGASHGTATIIAEIENTLGVILEYTFYGSQNGKWEFFSELSFQRNEQNSEYHNVVVKYYGADHTGKPPRTEVYTFSGTKYVLLTTYEEK